MGHWLKSLITCSSSRMMQRRRKRWSLSRMIKVPISSSWMRRKQGTCTKCRCTRKGKTGRKSSTNSRRSNTRKNNSNSNNSMRSKAKKLYTQNNNSKTNNNRNKHNSNSVTWPYSSKSNSKVKPIEAVHPVGQASNAAVS